MQHEQQSELEKMEDINSFHVQVRALIEAKIPVCLEDRMGDAPILSIESLQARLNTHLSSAGTIEGFLFDETLPVNYRLAMREWLQGERRGALERLTAGVEGQQFYRNAVGFVFLQASLILGSVLIGMICVCLWLVPTMERLQSNSFVPPGFGMASLNWLNAGLPYWGPLLFAIGIFVLLFNGRILGWLLARWAPLHPDSFALTEFQSLFSRPARFQWLVSVVIVACGICVLVQALSVFGVTIEILTQLVQS